MAHFKDFQGLFSNYMQLYQVEHVRKHGCKDSLSQSDYLQTQTKVDFRCMHIKEDFRLISK